jgi:hypothetical protein
MAVKLPIVPDLQCRKSNLKNEGVLTSWVDGEAGEEGVAAARSASPEPPPVVAAPLVKAEGDRGAAAGLEWNTLFRGASGGMRVCWGDSPVASGALGTATAAPGCKDVETYCYRSTTTS